MKEKTKETNKKWLPGHHPGGQPSKYKPEFCDQIIEFMRTGRSKEAFAAEINVHRDTLLEWTKRHKEFSDSVKRAEVKSLAYWEKIGEELIKGTKKGNIIGYIFMMKAKFSQYGYVDRQQFVGEGDKPLGVIVLPLSNKANDPKRIELTKPIRLDGVGVIEKENLVS